MKKYIVLLCLGIISCANKPTKLSIILSWQYGTTFTGLLVAKDKGFYTQEGIDITILPGNASIAERVVHNKKAEFGVSYMEETILSKAKGMNIKSIAALGQQNLWGITVSGVTNMADIYKKQGHILGLNGFQNDLSRLSRIFNIKKMNLTNIFKIVNNLDPGVPEFGSGHAKAPTITCSVKYHYYTKLKIEKKPVLFIPIEKLEPREQSYSPILIAHEDFINKHPKIIQAFLKATEKGYRYAYKNRDEALEILNKYADPNNEFFRKQSLDIVSENWFNKTNDNWGKMLEERWQNKIDYFITENIIHTNLLVDDLVVPFAIDKKKIDT